MKILMPKLELIGLCFVLQLHRRFSFIAHSILGQSLV
jgi:hypothetical protein